MFPHQKHVWFIGCLFNTPYPTCACSMHWSCIAHSQLLHTPLLPFSCNDLYLVSSSQHIMFVLYFVALCFVLGLSFIFSFILHSSCIVSIVRSFISCLLFSLTLCLFLTKRGRVFSREYTEVFLYILRGRNSISHAHLQGERYSIGKMHISRGRRHCVNKKTLFCLFFFMFVFLFALWCFELCLVSMLCCSHCIMFVCWTCIHPYAIVLH